MELKMKSIESMIVSGVDEVGRGCIAGPVVAAAVILPSDFSDKRIKDSKQIKTMSKREEVEKIILQNAIAWGIGASTPEEIDQINILQATFLAMKRALDSCGKTPDRLLVDGDRFSGYNGIPFECIIKGDTKIPSISAASILAKTHRDRLMVQLSKEFPVYKWETNVGYGTADHIGAIRKTGLTKYHRRTFCLNFI